MFLFLFCSPDWDATLRLIWQQTKPPWRRQGTVWSRRQLTSKCRMIMLLLLRVLVDITATLIEIRWSWWRSWRPLWPPWWRDLLSTIVWGTILTCACRYVIFSYADSGMSNTLEVEEEEEVWGGGGIRSKNIKLDIKKHDRILLGRPWQPGDQFSQ